MGSPGRTLTLVLLAETLDLQNLLLPDISTSQKLVQKLVDHKMGFLSGGRENKEGYKAGDPVMCDKDSLGRKMLNI